jgi:LAO/AO transport system kinase
LVESTHPKHREKSRELVRKLLPDSGNSIRVGITGVPGVGKSTFIEALGQHLTEKGHRVAVLAVDPSSSIRKGSILGDKTRMTSLVNNPNVYIRPSASGTTPGGVSRKTRESIILCEAAGFDIILIETVGVGQSETAVHAMTDFFLLLKLPGAGDELQGIKRGIVEMADAVVINKADGDNLHAARLAQTTFGNALHLFPPKPGGWHVPVLIASALNNENIDKVWNTVNEYVSLMRDRKEFENKRLKQEQYWLYETLNNAILDEFYRRDEVKNEIEKQLALIKMQKTTPYEAADILLKLKDNRDK